MSLVRIFKTAMTGLALSAAIAGGAFAASFSIVNNGGGTSTTLPSTFDLSYINGALSPNIGDSITAFSGTAGSNVAGGLFIDATSNLTYTYLGKEAGARNAMFTIGGATLNNQMSSGSSVTVNQTGPGFVDFLFQTAEAVLWEDINGNGIKGENLSIQNNGLTQHTGLSMAFGVIFNNGRSILAFFGDGRGDVDYDDMVIRIDAVPLPAAGLMLLGALGGLGAMRLRRKARTA